jgi:hypothetical protein
MANDHIESIWDRIIAAKQKLHAENTARLRPHFEKWAEEIEKEREKKNETRAMAN